MDKQKQIKEMAQFLYNQQKWCDMTNPYEVAKLLCNKGYRKIPENAVVLTGVRFEGNEGKTLFTDGDWKFSEQLTPIKVTSKEPLSEEDYESAKILCMKHCEFLPKCQEQTLKETVEKFAERLKTECFDGGIDDKWVAVSFSRLDEIVKEIMEGKV